MCKMASVRSRLLFSVIWPNVTKLQPFLLCHPDISVRDTDRDKRCMTVRPYVLRDNNATVHAAVQCAAGA